jgi:ubiquinone/menaquinone biosynthesis C-methylase UbiE
VQTLERRQTPLSAESDQRALFDRIADEYQAHYGDPQSLTYRNRFINRHLFAGIPLAGKKVLDAACGSGETTAYLVDTGAQITGLDISPNMVAAFQQKFPQAVGVCGSIFETGLDDASFDCVSIVGGLHHFHPQVERAVAEVHRVLKPGGHFVFFEPPTGTLPDIVRKFWYRRCAETFADNEAAVDTARLAEQFAGRFRPISQRYGGNLAYLLVLNSMHFHIPAALKRWYAPGAMLVESLIAPWQPRLLSCFTICQWQKLAHVSSRPIHFSTVGGT